MVDRRIPLPGALDLNVAAKGPLRRMLHHPCPDHFEIHVDDATKEMLVGLHDRRMVAVFPEGSFSLLPPAEFLCGAAGDELHGSGASLPLSSILYRKVDVVGGDRVVQDMEIIALLRFEEPVEPPFAIGGKLEQEILPVAPVGDVPGVSGQVTAACSGHLFTPSYKETAAGRTWVC